jgi:hypothetical protein
MGQYGIPTWYNGILYPSKVEANYAAHLDKLKSQGKIKWWKRQVRFQVEDSVKRYTVITDFLVMTDREEIHEVKRGRYTDEFIYKSQLWLEQYPNFPYIVADYTVTGWKYTPLADFIKPYLLVQDAPKKQYSKLEIKLSQYFYKLATALVKLAGG